MREQEPAVQARREEEPSVPMQPEQPPVTELQGIVDQMNEVSAHCDVIRWAVYEIGQEPLTRAEANETRESIAATLAHVIQRAGDVVSQLDDLARILRIACGPRLFQPDEAVLSRVSRTIPGNDPALRGGRIDQELDRIQGILRGLVEAASDYVNGTEGRSTSPEERQLRNRLEAMGMSRKVEYLQHVSQQILARVVAPVAEEPE